MISYVATRPFVSRRFYGYGQTEEMTTTEPEPGLYEQVESKYLPPIVSGVANFLSQGIFMGVTYLIIKPERRGWFWGWTALTAAVAGVGGYLVQRARIDMEYEERWLASR